MLSPRAVRAGGRSTIVLDDVDRYPIDAQARIQEELAEIEDRRRLTPEMFAPGPRFVATARGSVSGMVAAGRFLPELYHRINVLQVDLPPLRERHGDLPLLLAWFVRRVDQDRRYRVTDDSITALRSYAWPGNVRELESSVQRAIALAGTDSELTSEQLLPRGSKANVQGAVRAELRTLKDVLSEMEREHILRTIETLRGNRGQAAEALGISRKNLWEKLKSFGVSPENFDQRFTKNK